MEDTILQDYELLLDFANGLCILILISVFIFKIKDTKDE